MLAWIENKAKGPLPAARPCKWEMQTPTHDLLRRLLRHRQGRVRLCLAAHLRPGRQQAQKKKQTHMDAMG